MRSTSLIVWVLAVCLGCAPAPEGSNQDTSVEVGPPVLLPQGFYRVLSSATANDSCSPQQYEVGWYRWLLEYSGSSGFTITPWELSYEGLEPGGALSTCTMTTGDAATCTDFAHPFGGMLLSYSNVQMSDLLLPDPKGSWTVTYECTDQSLGCYTNTPCSTDWSYEFEAMQTVQ